MPLETQISVCLMDLNGVSGRFNGQGSILKEMDNAHINKTCG